MKIIVFTRFNRLHKDKIEQHGFGWRVPKTIANPDWWKKRLPVMAQTLNRSLHVQQFKDFEAWAIFTSELLKDNAYYTAMQVITNNFGYVKVIEDPAPYMTYLDEPYQECVRRFRNTEEPIVLVNVDSDDMIADWCLDYINRYLLRVEMEGNDARGMVFTFEKGYALDWKTGKLYPYDASGAPANFNAMVYYPEAFKSNEAWIEYKDKYMMNQRHYELNKANNVVVMPDGAFLHVVHDVNTSMAMNEVHFASKLGDEITNPNEQYSIFERFGREPY